MLKLISLRIGMLGLDEVAASNQAGPTLIIDGTEEEYVAQLQAFVAQREAAKRPPPGAPDHGDVSLESLQHQPPPTPSDTGQASEANYNLVI